MKNLGISCGTKFFAGLIFAFFLPRFAKSSHKKIQQKIHSTGKIIHTNNAIVTFHNRWSCIIAINGHNTRINSRSPPCCFDFPTYIARLSLLCMIQRNVPYKHYNKKSLVAAIYLKRLFRSETDDKMINKTFRNKKKKQERIVLRYSIEIVI